MALEIPATVHQAMKEGNKAWDKLVMVAATNRGTWSKEQVDQLALMAEVIKHLQHALNRLINANS